MLGSDPWRRVLSVDQATVIELAEIDEDEDAVLVAQIPRARHDATTPATSTMSAPGSSPTPRTRPSPSSCGSPGGALGRSSLASSRTAG